MSVLREAPGTERVLTPEALTFVAGLQTKFGEQLRIMLQNRHTSQMHFDTGLLPYFREETEDVRDGDWCAAPVPEVLADRRVEITGPVDRKMMINALNSGAKVFMADFEDATAPSFANIIAGHANMLDYREGTLALDDAKTGKSYRVGDNPALLIPRPRGLHLMEENVFVDGRPISAALFDIGLLLFHCGEALHAKGIGPFFYLPKIQGHTAARFWNNVLNHCEDVLGLPQGTTKVTVLIETLPAAFVMDEIIHELQDRIVGLNCGRWDYIFSYIKCLREHPAYLLPDRAQVTMDRDFLAAYSDLLVQTCHRRGIHAMGGMAAQIPVKGDEAANSAAFDKVRADKLREVKAGHDGTWVAHPDLVPVAMEVFDTHMPGPNQIDAPRETRKITEEMLLAPHQGQITEAGVRGNLSVAIAYLANWISGRGAVPLNNLMEDAATAEIARMQLWQWNRHGAIVHLSGGGDRKMSEVWLAELIQQEIETLLAQHDATGFHRGRYASAIRIVQEAVLAKTPPEFLTIPAYAVLNALD
ncbi:MAG: malate synthase A [Paracoccus sp. (in: a-proteobacteria)]|uniref:malate synthase A n=1 Tax=Paracoccus sp. TaxID=267 RepID=UPI0026E0140F|nr:malate synthase A [Paracoccus sp. (in: a-proteobacteria)]MDO5622893.1 malate synthase A [Paracoccus sp. (in: a-proteobacteria)]